jgi:hypothetical protein
MRCQVGNKTRNARAPPFFESRGTFLSLWNTM